MLSDLEYEILSVDVLASIYAYAELALLWLDKVKISAVIGHIVLDLH